MQEEKAIEDNFYLDDNLKYILFELLAYSNNEQEFYNLSSVSKEYFNISQSIAVEYTVEDLHIESKPKIFFEYSNIKTIIYKSTFKFLNRETIIKESARQGYFSLLKELLSHIWFKKNYDYDLLNEGLIIGCANNYPKIIELFVRNGANLHCFKGEPFNIATRKNCIEAIQMLTTLQKELDKLKREKEDVWRTERLNWLNLQK